MSLTFFVVSFLNRLLHILTGAARSNLEVEISRLFDICYRTIGISMDQTTGALLTTEVRTILICMGIMVSFGLVRRIFTT